MCKLWYRLLMILWMAFHFFSPTSWSLGPTKDFQGEMKKMFKCQFKNFGVTDAQNMDKTTY